MSAATQPETAPLYRLGGRTFRLDDGKGRTAKHCAYLAGIWREIDAQRILSDVTISETERAERALTRIYRSGYAFLLLSACLVEEGKRWDRGEAERNAARFEQIVDEKEQSDMWGILGGIVFLLSRASLLLAPTAARPS